MTSGNPLHADWITHLAGTLPVCRASASTCSGRKRPGSPLGGRGDLICEYAQVAW